MERSSAEEITQPVLGNGEVLRGEGILADVKDSPRLQPLLDYVIAGALIVAGEDCGAGAGVILARPDSFALKSSLLLIDPRPALHKPARMVEEASA